jgi:ABC-type transport system involved in multi-copper enzyme maturation permease subunit
MPPVIAALRIFRKDIHELCCGMRTLILVLVLPPLLLLIVGRLQTTAPQFRLLLAGVPDCSQPVMATEVSCRFSLLLRQLSGVKVAIAHEHEASPLAALRNQGFDTVVDFQHGKTPTFFVATTDPFRAQSLALMIAALKEDALLTQADEADRRNGRGAAKAGDQDHALPSELVLLLGIKALTSSRAFVYFPLTVDPKVNRLPMTIALILCILPFILAAPTIFKEKKARTLEILLTSPQASPTIFFVGKCLMPLAITSAVFLIMIICVQSCYHLYIRPLYLIGTVMIPAMLASTLAGLAVSAAVESEFQAMMSVAVYFLGSVLLSGFLLPTEQGSGIVRAIARLLPLTFLRPGLDAWMLGMGSLDNLYALVTPLLGECLIYLCLAVVLCRRMLHQI